MRQLAKVLILLAFTFNALAADPQDVMVTDQNLMLSKQQLFEFYENGILIIPGFFTPQEVAQTIDSATRLQNEANKLAKSQTGKIMYHGTQIVLEEINHHNELLRIVWAGAAEPKLLALSRQSKMLVPISQILNSAKADQLNNQLHYKFPNGGADITFYQDIRNRKRFDPDWKDLNERGSFVLAIIALDPMNAELGTIYYVPKSHTKGDLELDTIKDPVEFKKVAMLDMARPLNLKPGDLVIWHPYLIHGAIPNKFTNQRRIFINGFAYPGANTKPYPGVGSAQTIDLK